MILSPGRSFVFVHIPKTGGTALSLALEARAKADDILIGDTPKAQRRRKRQQALTARGRIWKHARLSDIEGMVPDAVLDGMFSFTLVRNPWDRAVSYYHWLRMQRFDHDAVLRAQKLDFEAFILDSRTQAEFQHNPAASYMRRSDCREQCDAYIRLEYFKTDAARLFEHLGFEFDLERVNASERARDHRGYYTPVTQQAIARCCAQDIAQFGYQFDQIGTV